VLKSNLLANYLGQGWSAVMALGFIPLYIKYLGMEAFGLIGIFGVMQAWIILIDLGMTPTLNREMALFKAGASSLQSIHNLLRSLEILCVILSIMITIVLSAASGYLSTEWIKAETYSSSVVASALSAMALVLALRFVEGIYRGSLFGLQQQVLYNRFNAFFATLRYGGAVAVLAFISRSIQAFFIWQALVSFLSLYVFYLTVHRALPKPTLSPRFSLQAISAIWKFAAGMVGISFLALLLTQVDKIILSRVLSLQTFGYYAFATTIATSLTLVIGPITQAIYPVIVELSTLDDDSALVSMYHKGAQLVTVLTAPFAGLLSLYGGGVVMLWSGNSNLAEHTAPILFPLVIGTFLNGLMWMPYQCQLAHGWTSLTIKSNILAVLVLTPAVFWVAPRYGAVGAAWIWVILNAAYALIFIQFMHRRLIPSEKKRWYVDDVVLPVSGPLAVFFLSEYMKPLDYNDRWHWLVFLLITALLALIASLALANRLKPKTVEMVRGFFA
jgi:O-antigen/teichoic acid export membrane protein